MRLADYARSSGVTYKTAWRWWKAGALKGYQLPSGTIILNVDEQNSPTKPEVACIDARVSSLESQEHLERQANPLKEYAIARGYTIQSVAKKVGNGLNDSIWRQ